MGSCSKSNKDPFGTEDKRERLKAIAREMACTFGRKLNDQHQVFRIH